MKKILALVLALCMVFALCACGQSAAPAATEAPAAAEEPAAEAPAEETPAEETEAPAALSADDIDDTMTSDDGKYEVAFVTDVGQLKDKSFNQGTFDGVKLYAAENGLSYKYYQPANGDQATDDDRYDAMKAAVDGGAKVVVCAGFLQETALKKAAAEFSDVSFIFIDGYPVSDDDGNALANVAGISFKEEQCGYFAGYAVVKEGYTKLGFTGGGGGTNPACCRYGYGFVEGANAAAAEMGVNVEVNYSWEYGASFSPSQELQTMASGWYETGTEIIFCCGGNMYQSVAQAAAENDAYMVGVDTDQSPLSETIITSAMKGLSDGVQWGLAYVFEGSFADIAGKSTTLSAKENAVGLPTATWSLKNFTVEQYQAELAKIVNGEITVDNNFEMSNPEKAELSNVKVNFVG